MIRITAVMFHLGSISVKTLMTQVVKLMSVKLCLVKLSLLPPGAGLGFIAINVITRKPASSKVIPIIPRKYDTVPSENVVVGMIKSLLLYNKNTIYTVVNNRFSSL